MNKVCTPPTNVLPDAISNSHLNSMEQSVLPSRSSFNQTFNDLKPTSSSLMKSRNFVLHFKAQTDDPQAPRHHRYFSNTRQQRLDPLVTEEAHNQTLIKIENQDSINISQLLKKHQSTFENRWMSQKRQIDIIKAKEQLVDLTSDFSNHKFKRR